MKLKGELIISGSNGGKYCNNKYLHLISYYETVIQRIINFKFVGWIGMSDEQLQEILKKAVVKVVTPETVRENISTDFVQKIEGKMIKEKILIVKN